MTLKSITAYRWYRNDFSEDTDGSPLPVQIVVNHTRHWQVSQELRLNGSIGSFIDYTLGGFYLKERGNGAARVDLNYGGSIDFVQNDPTPARSIAGFAQVIGHLTPKMDLIAGYRFTNDHKDYTFIRQNPDGSAIQPIDPVTGYIPPNGFLYGLDGSVGRYRKSRSDYRVDLTYRWTDDFMTYAQVSTGYKGGGVNPRPYFPSQIVAIQPETMTAFEVGFKSDLFDRVLRLNASAFYNDYRDIQLTTTRCDAISPFPGAPCFAPLNVGTAHIKGLEAEATLQPIEGLLIDATGSYLDFNYITINPDSGVVKGNISPYTPKWKWSIGAQYEAPIGDLGSLTPRIDASYQSTSWSLAANSPLNILPGYTLVNARLTWRSPDRSWQAALEVANLTDKYYLLSKQVPSGSGYINGQPAMPRRFAVSVRKTF
jgi:iron complex outermembrane receptor protein